MTSQQADVVVIGMGPGGEDLGGRLAKAGIDVVGIDHTLLGGECPYWGCIPSKMMIRAANLLAEARRIPGLAGKATVEPDWAPVAQRIRDDATDDWDDKVAVDRFEGKGGRFIRGAGRIVAPGRVAVGDTEIEARRGIVVASGTQPNIPDIPGLANTPFWTNREAIETKELPASLLVLGGGSIGVELAQVFARFGVKVTVVEARNRLVSRDEPEACHILAGVFESEGIEVHQPAEVAGASHDGSTFTLELADGRSLTAAQLLVATGRNADLAAVGLGAVGVDESQRWVPVDDHLRVSGRRVGRPGHVDGVWAVGDITGKGAFTHVAMYQSGIAVADILGNEHAPADYRALPRVTFTDPEIGSVGLTESDARDAGIDVRTGVAEVPGTSRGYIHKAGNEGLIKVVADAQRGVLVGGTTMAPAGGEMIGLLAVAVHAEVPIERLGQMMYAYPTFHRGIEYAVGQVS